MSSKSKAVREDSESKQDRRELLQSWGVVCAILFGFLNLFLHCQAQVDQDARWDELDRQRAEDKAERLEEKAKTADGIASAAIRLYWDEPSLATASEIMRLRKTYPNQIPLMVTEAAIRLENDEYDIASNLLEEIRKRDPDNVDALTYSGVLHLKWLRYPQGYDKAVEYFEAARECFDDSDKLILPDKKEYVLYLLGVAYQRVGDLDAAVDALRAAKAVPLPDSDRRFTVPRLLGIIYSAQGKKELAITEFETARDLDPDNQDLRALLEWARNGA